MTKVLDCSLRVSKFKLQSYYNIQFLVNTLRKGMNLLIPWQWVSLLWWQLHKNAVSNIEQVQEAAPHKTTAVRPPTTHHKNYPS